jgi:hypothetical protein
MTTDVIVSKLLIEIENPACRTLRANNTMHSLGWDEILAGCVEQFAEHDTHEYMGCPSYGLELFWWH